jgi:hypothetical protein
MQRPLLQNAIVRRAMSSYRPASYYRAMNLGSDGSLPANTIIKFVPQQQAWIVERFGKFNRILEPGLAILLPFVDTIKYVQTLKEQAIEIPSQAAITQGMHRAYLHYRQCHNQYGWNIVLSDS